MEQFYTSLNNGWTMIQAGEFSAKAHLTYGVIIQFPVNQ